MTSLVKRSSLIKPILDINPAFATVYTAIVAHDRFSKFAYEGCLKYNVHNTHCVMKKDPRGGKDVTHLMLFPFTVTMASSNVFGTLHGGMLMTLVDMCTSFHIAEQLLPQKYGHVSVNLSTNFLTAAQKDAPLVAVTRVEKLGSRLVYTSVDILLDLPNAATVGRTHPDTADGVEAMLREYTVVANGKHVKSILKKVELAM